jgi:hypothetical protein
MVPVVGGIVNALFCINIIDLVKNFVIADR